jgi:hypothetical protein
MHSGGSMNSKSAWSVRSLTSWRLHWMWQSSYWRAAASWLANRSWKSTSSQSGFRINCFYIKSTTSWISLAFNRINSYWSRGWWRWKRSLLSLRSSSRIVSRTKARLSRSSAKKRHFRRSSITTRSEYFRFSLTSSITARSSHPITERSCWQFWREIMAITSSNW